ncbi:MAG TPA: DUF1761 domain-containing protein [Candidatus Nanoarchaeia archaeon]|nr:DUF1761 domain-containing protein [Candidatus Nanoarchaeia archaeon]
MALPVVNYWAVLVCGIISMFLGFMWYGPLFGKMWIGLMKFDKKKVEEAKKKGMEKTFVVAFVSALIMNYFLALFVGYTQAATVIEGLQTGFHIWLGFIATIMLGSILWEGKPFKLYLLNVSHYLAVFLINGAILAVWA